MKDKAMLRSIARYTLKRAGLQFFSGSIPNGAVSADATFSNITFEAPDGRFNSSTLLTMTLSGALQSIATTLDASPLSEWDAFANWLGTERAGFINQVLTMYDCIVVNGTEYEIPTISGITNFRQFAQWIISLLGDAANDSAASYWDADATKFVVPVSLVIKPKYYLKFREEPYTDNDSAIPSQNYNPEQSWYSLFFQKDPEGNGHAVQYGTLGGILDRAVLMMPPYFCPTFESSYGAESQYAERSFSGIAYMFETTTATSLGVTLPVGWYVANPSTFDLIPFDIVNNPIQFALGDMAYLMTRFGGSFRSLCFLTEVNGGLYLQLSDSPEVPTEFFGSQDLSYRFLSDTLAIYNLPSSTHQFSSQIYVFDIGLSPGANAFYGAEYTDIVYLPEHGIRYYDGANPSLEHNAGWYVWNPETHKIKALNVYEYPLEFNATNLYTTQEFATSSFSCSNMEIMESQGQTKQMVFTFDI